MNVDKKLAIAFRQLGLHIKNLREERDISIKELSKKTGIREEYLTKIENGTAYGVMLERHLAKIAKVFEIKFSQLFEFDNYYEK